MSSERVRSRSPRRGAPLSASRLDDIDNPAQPIVSGAGLSAETEGPVLCNDREASKAKEDRNSSLPDAGWHLCFANGCAKENALHVLRYPRQGMESNSVRS